MNTYACWHQGIFGYCFLHPHSGWWFIPELNQPDSAVYRYLQLSDLVFINAREYRHELRNERRRQQAGWWRRLKSLLFPAPRAHTVGGLLFLPGRH